MRNLCDRMARAICACIAVAAMSSANAGDSPANKASVDAVWKAQSMFFEYRSSTRLYSCMVLEDKIKMILRRLGARGSLKLRRYACTDHGGRARFEVLMESPVEATEDNVRAITAYNSTDQLVARLNGTQLPSAQDLPRFPAAWETISFRRDKLYLAPRDCTLLQQLRSQILPKMSVQVTKDLDAIDCSEEVEGLGPPRLTVQALVPVEGAP